MQGRVVCILFCFFIVGLQEMALGSEACPHGWVQSVVPRKCFRILRKKSTATESSDMCRDMGGYLASIESAAEQDFIRKYILNETDDWLRIGGKRNTGTKNWFWEDGTLMTYSNWNLNESGVEEDRIFMYLYSAKAHEGTDSYGNWHASHGNGRHDMLCQLRLPMPGATGSFLCPPTPYSSNIVSASK